MIEVLFPDEQQPTQLTESETAMRKLLAGVKRGDSWYYTVEFQKQCAGARAEWAKTSPWAKEYARQRKIVP